MYPRNSVDQNDPSGLSALQRERQAEMRQASDLEQALAATSAEPAPTRWLSRRRLAVALFGAVLLAMALAGIVAAVTPGP